MADSTSRPADFDAYWDAVDGEPGRYPAAPELERLALPSAEYSTVYAVKLTSIGPYRIFGYYSVPAGDGPFPGLLIAPRSGSVNHLPHLDDRQRYATRIAEPADARGRHGSRLAGRLAGTPARLGAEASPLGGRVRAAPTQPGAVRAAGAGRARRGGRRRRN